MTSSLGRALRLAAWAAFAALAGVQVSAAQGVVPGLTGGASASSNPNIGFVLNGYYSSFSKEVPFEVPGFVFGGETGPGEPGFNLGESELGIYGNIDPYLFGSAVIAFSTEEGAAVEEAFIQTLALPFGFTVKAGRFFSGIGYLNALHRHADDFFDAPLPYQAFLGGQFGDAGIQVKWLAPAELFLELGVEQFRGDEYPAGGAANDGAGARAAFVKLGGDIGDSGSYLLSLSQLQAKSEARTTGEDVPETAFTGDTTVRILGVVWKWSPSGNPKYTNVKVQAEYFQRDEDGVYTLDPEGTPVTVNMKGGDKGSQTGWYAQAHYQFFERWRVGIRQAQIEAGTPKDSAAKGTALDPQGETPKIATVMAEYDPSEFSQIRLQYSQDQSVPDESVARWYLQYVVTFGAHAAHSY
jgi:hypothetical protein